MIIIIIVIIIITHSADLDEHIQLCTQAHHLQCHRCYFGDVWLYDVIGKA